MYTSGGEVSSKKTKTEMMLHNLLKANGGSVSVGHFEESGKHPDADMSYPDLMKLHHFGGHASGITNSEVPARPVLEILQDSMPTPTKDKSIIKAIKGAKKGSFTREAVKGMLDEIGFIIGSEEKSIFGSDRLVGNSAFTIRLKGGDSPLIDAGSLVNHIAYKNSYDKQIKYLDLNMVEVSVQDRYTRDPTIISGWEDTFFSSMNYQLYGRMRS